MLRPEYILGEFLHQMMNIICLDLEGVVAVI